MSDILYVFLVFFFQDEPGMTDMKGKAKWGYWNSRKGIIKHLTILMACISDTSNTIDLLLLGTEPNLARTLLKPS